MNSDLLEINDVAEKLGVSVSTIRSWIRDRKIQYRKVGRFIRFTWEDINSFIVTKEPKK